MPLVEHPFVVPVNESALLGAHEDADEGVGDVRVLVKQNAERNVMMRMRVVRRRQLLELAHEFSDFLLDPALGGYGARC